jgi:hypothetical protein
LSETFVVAQLFLLLFLIGLEAASSRSGKIDRRLAVLLAGLAGTAARLMVIISAPGNAIRQAQLPPSPGFFDLIVISLQAFADFAADIFLSPEKAMALAGAIVLAAWLGAQIRLRLDIPGWKVSAWALGAVLLAFVCFPPAAYGYSGPPPPRNLIIAAFLLAACLLYAGFQLGNRLRDRIKSGLVHYGLATLAVLLPGATSVLQARALIDSRPVYVDYARYWDATDAQSLQAKADGEASVTVPVVGSWTGLNVPNDNPKFWVNDCYSKYYGIQVFGPSPD